MWWLSLTPYILPPSAAAAGLFTWFMTRSEQPEDGDLLRHFLLALGALLLLSAGAMQLDSVRNRWDPGVKARNAIAAMPVNQAWKKYFPDEWGAVEVAAHVSLGEGKSLAEVTSSLRSLYPLLARKRVPDAQGTAVIGYVNALVPVLQRLRSEDPKLCVRLALRHVPGAPFDALRTLDEAAQQAYEAAVVQLLQTSSKAAANGGTWRPEVGASARQVQEAWTGIVQAMPPSYANLMGAIHTPAVTEFDPAITCDANIQLLTRAANLPAPQARQLLVQLISGS
jgi:hypothetical protein